MAGIYDKEGLCLQVKRNCDISDAKHWGFFSICGLLLRLRELYRFEKGLRPWQKVEEADISEWIGQREALWKELNEAEFSTLEIDGDELGPFDVRNINMRLSNKKLLYGAGYGLFMKPSFFLAELKGREVIEGYDIYMAGKEYARDLSVHPAMLQGNTVFAREDALNTLLWERFEEHRSRKFKSAVSIAFSFYGLAERDYPPEEADRIISEIAGKEIHFYIRHELGEAFEGARLGPEWASMLEDTLGRRASIYLRAVKDALADTSDRGMLNSIIGESNTGAFAFYIVSLSGMRKALSHVMEEAFAGFCESGNWRAVDEARRSCYEKLAKTADTLIALYRAGNDFAAEVESRFMGVK